MPAQSCNRIFNTIDQQGVVGSDLDMRRLTPNRRGPITDVRETQGGVAIDLGWVAVQDGRNGVWLPWAASETVELSDNRYRADVRTIDRRSDVVIRPRTDLDEPAAWASHVILESRRSGLYKKLRLQDVEGMPESLTDRETWDFPRVDVSESKWDELDRLSANAITGNDRRVLRIAGIVRAQDGFAWPREQEYFAAPDAFALVGTDQQTARGIVKTIRAQLAAQTASPTPADSLR